MLLAIFVYLLVIVVLRYRDRAARAKKYFESFDSLRVPDGYLRFVAKSTVAIDTFSATPARTPVWAKLLVVSHFEHWLRGVSCPCPCPCDSGCRCTSTESRYIDNCMQFHAFLSNVYKIGSDRTAFATLHSIYSVGNDTAKTDNDVGQLLRHSAVVGMIGGRGPHDLLPLREQRPLPEQAAPVLPPMSSSLGLSGVDDSANAGQKRRRLVSSIQLPASASESSVSDVNHSSSSHYAEIEQKLGKAIVNIETLTSGFRVTILSLLDCSTSQQALSRLGETRLPLLRAALTRFERSGTTVALRVLREAIALEEHLTSGAQVANPGRKANQSLITSVEGSTREPRKVRVVEVSEDSSSDSEVPAPEAGPPAWVNPSNPRSSYLFHPSLDAQTLRDAETVLLPRPGGSRVMQPWEGWREGKIIARAIDGVYCSAGEAQCLWDEVMLTDGVCRFENKADRRHDCRFIAPALSACFLRRSSTRSWPWRLFKFARHL